MRGLGSDVRGRRCVVELRRSGDRTSNSEGDWAIGRWPTAKGQNEGEKVRAKLWAINAQTRPKTGEHQRPESKTNQQDREPSEICKTSIPGSNPGGASKFFPMNVDNQPAILPLDR